MRIATGLGYAGRRQLLADLSPQEWDELQAFYEAEPFGEHAADLRAAKLAAVAEPGVDFEAFLKTPGELRIEREEGGDGHDGEAVDAVFSVLMARQVMRETDPGKA